jgi:hypothetical protein
MKKENATFNELIAAIVEAYGCNREEVLKLIDITSNMSRGAKFCSINEYSSDVSKHSELANYLILLNFDYKNMLKDDKETLSKFDINLIDVNKFNYANVDTCGVELEVFKNEVREQLETALYEINNPSKKTRVNNDDWLNDMLVFNWNTKRLSIIGQGVKKSVIVEGDFNKTKMGAKTIAKKLIKKQADLRVDKYKRFAIDNLSVVNLQGETLEIQ